MDNISADSSKTSTARGDAGQGFEVESQGVEEGGATRGKHHPCCYSRARPGLALLAPWHVSRGQIASGDQCTWLRDQIVKCFIAKTRGILGPRHRDCKSMTMLHRLLVWVPHSSDGPERTEYSADPRHMELLCSQLGFQQGKSRSVATLYEKQAITPATEADI